MKNKENHKKKTIFDTIRKVWGSFYPVQRLKESKKRYSRKNLKWEKE